MTILSVVCTERGVTRQLKARTVEGMNEDIAMQGCGKHVSAAANQPKLKPSLSLERVLHKDYGRKGSVAKKKALVVSHKRLSAKTN
jgi:hypothetical protein